MSAITTKAQAAYAGDKYPIKSEIIGVFEEVDTQIKNVAGAGAAFADAASEIGSGSGVVVFEDGEFSTAPSSDFKGDPGGNVLAVGLFTGLGDMTIATGTDLIQTSGYSAKGIGSALYAEVLAGPAKAYRKQSANGRWFQLVTVNPTIDAFGAVGDGVTNDRPAFEAAVELLTARPDRLKLLSKTYFVSNSSYVTRLDLGSIAIDADPGAIIKGSVDLKSEITVDQNLTLDRQDTDFDYIPQTVWPLAPVGEKLVFMSEGDADYTRDIAVNSGSLTSERIAWATTGEWASFAASGANDDTIQHAMTNDGYFYADFFRMYGGEEISAAFDYGAYDRAAFIKTNKGTWAFICLNGESTASVYFKAYGAAPTLISTGIGWAGNADHLSWLPANSSFKVRCYTPNHWAVLLNGREVYGPTPLTSGEYLVSAGFGMRATTSITGATNYWTLTRNPSSPGRGMMDIAVFGDSTTAPIRGDWPNRLWSYLEGSFGLNVRRIDNFAVDGWNSTTTLATMTAVGTSGYSDVIILIGTNDVQGATDRTVMLSNVEAMINLAQGTNCRVTIGIFPTWYTNSLTGGLGNATSNYQLTSTYREGIKKLAARKGCKIVELNEEMKSALAYDALGNGTPDPGLRDCIHDTEARYRHKAWAFARALVGWWPKKTMRLRESPLSQAWAENGWVVDTATDANVSISVDGVVSLGGILGAGTKTDGTTIYSLPEVLRPMSQKVFYARSDAGTQVTLIVQSGGNIQIYGLGGASGVCLDNLTWQIDAL